VKTHEEAIGNIREAIELWIDNTKESGDIILKPNQIYYIVFKFKVGKAHPRVMRSPIILIG
jgi:hypothetical protein